MKKLCLILFIIITAHQVSIAQWTTSGTNAYFNLTGNVGIGTTSPVAKLDVAGNTTATNTAQVGTFGIQSYATNSGFITDNGYFSSSMIYRQNGAMELLQFSYPSAGDLSFRFAPSGTAGASATLQTNLTIKNTGNVGIGTNSPLTIFSVAVPSPKATVIGNVVSFLSTNDATNPFGLRTMIYGASSIGSRYVTLQTTDYSLVDGGNLVLQSTVGNVAIGTTDTRGYKFAVNGTAIATAMTVMLHTDWPDYVFKPAYQLLSLSKVKTYIDQNQHLPELPSGTEIAKNGINLGEINTLLTKKVEELTLYLIEQEKTQKQQEERISQLEESLKQLLKHKQ